MEKLKKFLKALFIFLFFNSLYAENRIALSSSILELNIGNQIYILPDEKKEYDIQNIITKKSDFQKSTRERPNFGYTDTSYWIYIPLSNTENHINKFLLNYSYPLMDYIDYYLVREGKIIQEVHTGDMTPFSNRIIEHRNFLFPIELEAYENIDIFMKFKTSGSIEIPLYIISYKRFIEGDEIMALFDDSVKMKESLKEVNQKISRLGIEKIDIGIGLNYGKLVLGTVGSQLRLDTTVVGDTVNTASRIQQLTRKFDVPILLTEEVIKNIKNKDKFYLRRLQSIKVKGKDEPVKLYECFNTDEDRLKEKKLLLLPRYEEAVQLYTEKKYLEAYSLFRELYQENPEDKVLQIWMEYLETYVPS